MNIKQLKPNNMKTIGKILIVVMGLSLLSEIVNGQNWYPIGTVGSDYTKINKFYKHSNGNLIIIGDNPSSGIVQSWNGLNQTVFGQGTVTGNYTGFAESNGNLYIGRTSTPAAPLYFSDGNSNWINPSISPMNVVNMDGYQNFIYWTTGDQNLKQYIGSGTIINDVSPASSGKISIVKNLNDTLYVGGSFTHSGIANTPLAYFAGSSWVPTNNNLWTANAIGTKDVEKYNGNIYIVGYFGTGGSGNGYCFAKLNSSNNWNTISLGNNAPLTANLLEVYNGKLYIATSNKIYEYDDVLNNVTLLDSVNGGTISTMINYNGYLYIGGNFTDIHGLAKIARYTNVTAGFASSTNVLCNGGNTGSATANMSGDYQFKYNWSNGKTTQSISNLSVGSYIVNITDVMNGNDTILASAQITIDEPAVLETTQIVYKSMLNCFGATDGYVEISASGGTMSYIYNWSNSNSNSIASNLSGGDHSVTITDANGCTNTQNITINEPNSLALNLANGNICQGSSNGLIIASISGGTLPYSYNWSNGYTSSSISNLSVGSYSVVITDMYNCQILTGSASINEIVLNATINANGNTTFCSGGNVKLSANNGYNYLWSNGSTTKSITALTQNTYNVTITNGNGCQDSEQISVIVNSIPSVSINPDYSVCGTVTLNAITSANIFNWSNTLNTQNINVTDGNYNVTVTDGNGCQNSATFSAIIQPCVDPNTGINENASSVVSVYPNPFVDSFTVNVTGAATMRLSDVLGHTVRIIQLNNTTVVSREDLTTGIYIYSIITNDNVINGRIVVE